MTQTREVLLRKLTGLLKRITDTDDDYTVTADQRAALMELETLTWNYPTPQQGRGRGNNIPATSFPLDDQTDTDDDDDDDSYYVDMVPYDMTERLKEVNRAFIDDPTPAECGRTITIRFREVIADYQSPREYYPSDSDDGYGDSSDLIYDAEEDDGGLTSLTSEVRDILADNVKVVDFLPHSTQDNEFGDYSDDIISSSFVEDHIIKDDKNSGVKSILELENEDNSSSIPKLHLNGELENAKSKPLVGDFQMCRNKSYTSSQGGGEINLLKVDDSGLADLEGFMKESEVIEVDEELSKNKSASAEDRDLIAVGSVSLIESSDQIIVEKRFNSLDPVGTTEIRTKKVDKEVEKDIACFQRKETAGYSSSSSNHISANSDADFATFDYADDFEEFNEDVEDDEDEDFQVNNNEDETHKQMQELPSSDIRNNLVHEHRHTEREKKRKDSKNQNQNQNNDKLSDRKNKHSTEKELEPKLGHKSRRDQNSRRSVSPSSGKKKRSESRSPAETPELPARTKSKRSPETPTIKPALLSSDKLSHMKTNDSSRYKSRSPTSSRSVKGSIATSSSSSSSSSSNSLSASSSASLRSRSRTQINGPIRPTQYKGPSMGRPSTSRVISNSPVRSSTSPVHSGLTLSPTNPSPPPPPSSSGRPTPPYRVRKAASASDLHSRIQDDSDDRKKQSEAVFNAWLQQKNKQAALVKKQQRKSSGPRANSEVTERRARAEEAFQAWLARKREQLRLEKRLKGERRRLEDQNRYARTKAECEIAYKEWCRRKKDEVRTVRPNGVVPRSQSLERPWVQEKTRKLYSAYLNGH